ncbi:unnamed protein product [Triticum turgidum subsp. durum]|uniref:Hydrophobic seed protein domain-containing protein n=1 Tax=Triticum turgidum subsp. durum TaxID=4567 RepID=A0A9R0V9V8_TRITD|nr:unnamed protein product [Triticum turgidum subsp. durum]
MAMAPRALLFLAVGLMVVASASAHGGYYGSCPRDMLKVKACVNVLGLLKVNVNQPRDEHCCSLLDGLAGLDAALCL